MVNKDNGELIKEIQELAKELGLTNPSIIITYINDKLRTILEVDDPSKITIVKSNGERVLKRVDWFSSEGTLEYSLDKIKKNVLAQSYYRLPDPKVICLCGSTRFYKQFQEINLEETLAGNIVLSIGYDGGSDHSLGLTDKQKRELDWLHKKKIEMSDEIIVIRLDTYIGESTAREIEFAKELNLPIRYADFKTIYDNDSGLDPYSRPEKIIKRIIK